MAKLFFIPLIVLCYACGSKVDTNQTVLDPVDTTRVKSLVDSMKTADSLAVHSRSNEIDSTWLKFQNQDSIPVYNSKPYNLVSQDIKYDQNLVPTVTATVKNISKKEIDVIWFEVPILKGEMNYNGNTAFKVERTLEKKVNISIPAGSSKEARFSVDVQSKISSVKILRVHFTDGTIYP